MPMRVGSSSEGGKLSIRGADYVVMANSFIQALNKGGVPVITDAWTEVIEGQARTAIAKATRHYQKELKQFL